MSQLAYGTIQDPALIGMLADSSFKHTESMVTAEAIPFGRIVVRTVGTNNVCRLPNAITDIPYGVAQRTLRIEDTDLPGGLTAPQYPAGAVANILRRGRIWVWSETAFNPDTDTLFCRAIVNGAGTAVGQVRNAADGVNTFSLATFPVAVLSRLTAAGLLLIESNLP